MKVALPGFIAVAVLAGFFLLAGRMGAAELIERAESTDLEGEPTLQTGREKLSYALGMSLGSQLRDKSVEIDFDLYFQGLKDGFAGSGALMSEAEVRAAIREFQKEMNKKQSIPPAAGPLADIKVSFKLDPHLTRGIYMGDRWVSPPTFTSTLKKGDKLTLEARARGLDAKGMKVPVSIRWTPDDPDMVEVEPAEGNEVTITVKSDGESGLTIASPGFSKVLLIKADCEGDAIRAKILQ